MKTPPDSNYRHRFPADLISHAIWLYHVFSLSFRDVELILAERGVTVSYESIRRLVRIVRRELCGKASPATAAAGPEQHPGDDRGRLRSSARPGFGRPGEVLSFARPSRWLHRQTEVADGRAPQRRVPLRRGYDASRMAVLARGTGAKTRDHHGAQLRRNALLRTGALRTRLRGGWVRRISSRSPQLRRKRRAKAGGHRPLDTDLRSPARHVVLGGAAGGRSASARPVGHQLRRRPRHRPGATDRR